MLLKNARAIPARDPARPRTVIVGSGAVGLYTAAELTRLGQDVVVIESGDVHLGSFAPEEFTTVGRKHDGIRIGRSRSLGGTTNLWGGQLVEFQPSDFEGRDGLPGSRWPVRDAEIRPYYRRAYETLGVPESVQTDVPVLEHFLGSAPCFEDGLELFLTRWMKVPSFAVLYQKLLQRSPGVPALLHHTVTGFVSDGPIVRAVRVVGPAGETAQVEGDRFVLACGTIEISRLLLHAASADPSCPWRSNRNLGARFQDHLGGPIASVIPIDRRRLEEMFCTMIWSGHKFQPKVRLRQDARGDRLSIHGMFSFESSVNENLVYLKQFLKAALFSRKIAGIGDLFTNLRACARYLVPLMWRYVVDNRIFVPSTAKIHLVAQAEQVPVRESRISIDPASRGASGLPRVVLDWRLRGDELEALRDFALRCDRALRAAGVARLEIADALQRSDPRFLDTLRDTNHQAGGACMAAVAEDGVVDRDLRVFGTENLYVAGAATFPTSSGANTTFTALAFAARLVDHLSGPRALD